MNVAFQNQFDKNSISFIKLLASVQVFLGHATVHMGVELFPETLNRLFNVLQGVPVFFVLSGFLIWASLGRTKSFSVFCKKRILRLFPELWIGVLTNCLIMILLYRDNIEWLSYAMFQITQGTFLQFWTPGHLRGYGSGTPNGSLWTIGIMIQAYIIMWLLYKFLHRSKKSTWIITGFISVGLSFTPILVEVLMPEIVFKLYNQTFIPYIWLFILGALLSEFFEFVIIFLKKYWYCFACITLIIVYLDWKIPGAYNILRCIPMALAIVGFSYKFPQFALKKDYSYGIYIYHMIVINVMIHLGYTGKVIYIWIAFLTTCFLAIISYWTVGAFSRKKKEGV